MSSKMWFGMFWVTPQPSRDEMEKMCDLLCDIVPSIDWLDLPSHEDCFVYRERDRHLVRAAKKRLAEWGYQTQLRA